MPIPQFVPKLLQLTGDKNTWLETAKPGLWVPDYIDFIAYVEPTPWAAGVVQTLAGQWSTGAGRRSWAVNIDATGHPQTAISVDGQATLTTKTMTIANPLTAGGWMRNLYVGVTGQFSFYTSTNPPPPYVIREQVAWSAPNSPAPAGTGAPFNCTAELIRVGNKHTVPPLQYSGIIRYMCLLDSTGQPVFELDFSKAFAGTDSRGNKWNTKGSGFNWLTAQTFLSGDQSGNAVALATGGTITTAGVAAARVSPAGAVTGIIMQAGTVPGQQCVVINEAVQANTVTFDVAGTSHVADGATSPMVGQTGRAFVWDSGTQLWYRTA